MREKESVYICVVLLCVEHIFIGTAEDTHQKENNVYVFKAEYRVYKSKIMNKI